LHICDVIGISGAKIRRGGSRKINLHFDRLKILKMKYRIVMRGHDRSREFNPNAALTGYALNACRSGNKKDRI
jgi:hypothetical protein